MTTGPLHSNEPSVNWLAHLRRRWYQRMGELRQENLCVRWQVSGQLSAAAVMVALCLLSGVVQGDSTQKTDAAALLAWKATWSSVPSSFNEGPNAWRLGTLPCKDSWRGISCGFDGRVIGLTIKDEPNLQATLSSKSANLTILQTLILVKLPGLKGRLSRLPAFPNLMWLEVRETSVSGHWPKHLSDNGYTRLINLSSNRLGGRLPTWLPQYLDELDLSENKFSGKLPRTWSKLEVYNLKLAHNKLTGPLLPASLLPLVKENLDLHNNIFSGPLPEDWAQLRPAQEYYNTYYYGDPWIDVYPNIFLHNNPGLVGGIPAAWSEEDSHMLLSNREFTKNSVITLKPGTGLSGPVPKELQWTIKNAQGRSLKHL